MGAWACSFCAFFLGWQGDVDLGAGYVSDAAPRFANYRGLDEQGLFPSLNGEARYQDSSGRYLDTRVHELALDSRRIDARGGRRGAYQLRLGWHELPYWRGELKTQRKTLDFGASFKPRSRWRFDLDAQRQRKEGERPFAAGVFTLNASYLAVPVDYTTDRVTLATQYAGEQASFLARLSSSWFDNGATSISWTNPFPPVAGTEQLRVALEPDNRAWQLQLGGAWRPMPRLRLSGRAVLGRAQQDDLFLPYTINPTVPEQALPRPSLDGRVDTMNLDLAGRLNWRLSDRLDLAVRLAADERDNRTPVSEWLPVESDIIQRPGTRNRPYDFTVREGTADLRFRVLPDLRLRAGGRYRATERNLQAVYKTEETELLAEAEYQGIEQLRLRLKVLGNNREAGPYLAVTDPGLVENPLMRKYHLADRERRQAVLQLDFLPTAWFDLSLSLHATRDEYTDSPLGLTDSEDRAINLDAAWMVDERLALTAFASRQRIDARIRGAEEMIQPWRSTTRDEFDIYGVGLNSRWSEHLTIGMNYVASRGSGEIRTGTQSAEPAFPALVTDLDNLRLHVDFRWREHWDARLLLEHERYESRDWQVDGLAADDIEGVLTFDSFDPDYRVTVVRLLARYRY